MSIADLAKASGVPVPGIRVHISYPYSDRRAYKIEKALGAPVWTEARQFADLLRASELLGVDFYLTKFHPLRVAAVAKGVRHTRCVTCKEELLTVVLNHFAKPESKSSK